MQDEWMKESLRCIDEAMAILNPRRLELIQKKLHGGGLSDPEAAEFKRYQEFFGSVRTLYMRPMLNKLDELEKRLGIKL